MAVFKKDIIGPGTWLATDTTGKPLVVESTPERVRHWCQQAQAMLASGITVPLTWEHPDTDSEFHPASLNDQERWRSKLTAGYATRFYTEGDTLFADFEVPLEEDFKRIGTTVKRVSPGLTPGFTDGDGHQWQDIVAHVALTTKPIIRQQGDFVRTDLPPSRAVALSRPCGVISLLSESRGVPMAFGKPDDEKPDMGDEASTEAKVEDSEPTEKPEDPADKIDDPALQGKVDEKLIASLAAIGLVIPSGTTLGELQQSLLIALATAAATNAANTQEDTEDANEATLSGGEKKEETQVVMSRAAPKLDPATEARIKALEAENASFKGQAFAAHRSVVLSRVDKLHKEGRLSIAQKQALAKKMPLVRMSMGAAGVVLDDPGTTAVLDFASQLPKGTFWTPEEKASRMQEVSNEGFFEATNGTDTKAVVAATKELLSAVGR